MVRKKTNIKSQSEIGFEGEYVTLKLKVQLPFEIYIARTHMQNYNLWAKDVLNFADKRFEKLKLIKRNVVQEDLK